MADDNMANVVGPNFIHTIIYIELCFSYGCEVSCSSNVVPTRQNVISDTANVFLNKVFFPILKFVTTALPFKGDYRMFNPLLKMFIRCTNNMTHYRYLHSHI